MLQGLHRIWPPLIDFASSSAADLGHPVQVNAYVTPPQNQGFAAHYDVHDVFVLQVAGEKRWTHPRAGARAPAAPTSRGPTTARPCGARRRRPPVIDTVLRPGDALYLPRGWLHSAEALGETTVHLTVGIHAMTRYDVVEALVALAADAPALRASLPLGVDVADPGDSQADLDATVEALADRLAAATAADAADAVRRRVDRRPGPSRSGRWPRPRPRARSPGRLVRLRRHAQARLTEGRRPGRVGTDPRGGGPASCRPALEVLADGGAGHRRATCRGWSEADASRCRPAAA